RSYTVALLTRLQGLNARDHDFVREWNGGAEHLCALERNPLGITVAHATAEELVSLFTRALRAIRLGADDHVGEIQIAVARVGVVIAQSTGARTIVPLEQVDPHEHPAHSRGHVVGRATHHSAALARVG